MQSLYSRKEINAMPGKNIVSAVQDELQDRAGIGGYDNYQYPDDGGSYSNDDTDD